MKVSILIPYRPGVRARDEIWQWLLQRYVLAFPEAELVVSDDKQRNHAHFNRGQARNLAADQATGDIYVVGDADTAFNTAALKAAIEDVHLNGGWRVPSTYHQLDAVLSEELLEKDPTVTIDDPRYDQIIWTGYDSVAPILVIPAQAYHLVGGYDERYPSWGSDDRSFSIAMNTLYQPYDRWIGAVYHLWHPRAEEQDSGARLTLDYVQAEGDEQKLRRLRKGHRLT